MVGRKTQREGYLYLSGTTSSKRLKPTGHPALNSDQPRERVLRGAGSQVSAAELLAVVLGSGPPGESALALASRMLADFGGLDGVLQASVQRLLCVRGLGQAKVAKLKALHALTVRQAEDELRSQPMRDAGSVSRYFQRQLGHRSREIFAVAFLDARHHLLQFEELFSGSIDRAHVHPRELLRRGLELNAAAVILAHNHPSRVAEPSQADLHLTAELVELLHKVDIRVLDHFVIARSDWVSLASRGLMP